MTQPERTALLREPNFRWMMGGGLISSLGDQFTMVALPWLVLTMTGDPFKLGLVIALMSIPRAVFMLLGGALVDRYSPKSVLMLSKFANALMLALLAALVLSGQQSLPAVCVLALGHGTGFRLQHSGRHLAAAACGRARTCCRRANGMLMGMRQVTMLSGPLLAALVFAVFGDGSGAGAGAANGLGHRLRHRLPHLPAVGLDAGQGARPCTRRRQRRAGPVLRAIGEGLAMVWGDKTLAHLHAVLGDLRLRGGRHHAGGAAGAGRTRLHGAAALGLLMAVHGAGALLGMAADRHAGQGAARHLRPHPAGGRRRRRPAAVAAGPGRRDLAGRHPAGSAGRDRRLHAGGRVQLDPAARAARHAGPRDEHLHVHLHGPGAAVGGDLPASCCSICRWARCSWAPACSWSPTRCWRDCSPRSRAFPTRPSGTGLIRLYHASDAKIFCQPEHDVHRNPFPRPLRRGPGQRFRCRRIPVPVRLRPGQVAERLDAAGLQLVLHNLPPGDAAAGDRGMACDPHRVARVPGQRRRSALDYADALGVRQLHCLAGLAAAGRQPRPGARHLPVQPAASPPPNWTSTACAC